jgi:hypothetical protein
MFSNYRTVVMDSLACNYRGRTVSLACFLPLFMRGDLYHSHDGAKGCRTFSFNYLILSVFGVLICFLCQKLTLVLLIKL